MKQISKNNYKKEVTEFQGVVVADFYADWCGPCRLLSPVMEYLDTSNENENVKFIKVNVDEEQELAAAFGVMSIPTVIFFNKGKLVNQMVGIASKEAYLEAIKNIQTHS